MKKPWYVKVNLHASRGRRAAQNENPVGAFGALGFMPLVRRRIFRVMLAGMAVLCLGGVLPGKAGRAEGAVAGENGADVYAPVLEQYKEALRQGLYMDIMNGKSQRRWEHLDVKFVSQFIPFHARSYRNYGGNTAQDFYIYYALWDMNHDGAEELFIGAGTDENSVRLYDVLASENGQPRSLFGSSVFGERTNIAVYEDGAMIVEGSSAYNLSSITHYYLPAGSAVPVRSQEYGLEYGEYYHINEQGVREVIAAERFGGLWRYYEQLDKHGFSWLRVEADQPASSVVRVVFNHQEERVNTPESLVEYARIDGVDKDGNVQWTYTTGKYSCTELQRVKEIGIEYNRGLYYFNESGTVTALDLQTGQAAWKNSDFGGASISYMFLDTGDLFICGYYGPDFCWIDPDGKTVCRIEQLDKRYYWPDDIIYADGRVTVVMMQGPDGKYRAHHISFKLGDYKHLKYD